jgi:hypothetical protein
VDERTVKPDDDAGEKFLLAEYGYLSDSFWKNEESGEKRVNYLITLVTAVIAAIVTLTTRQGSLSDTLIALIALASCLALLAVGLLTFMRMIRREEVTDGYKRGLDDIRERFQSRDASGMLDRYDPFPPGPGTVRFFGRGGLTDLVVGVNSVIFAGAAASAAALSTHLAVILAATLAGFALSVALHAFYLSRRRASTRPRETESTLVVSSAAAAGVLEEVAALTEIGGYRLQPREDDAIRDLYFDTPDRKLEAMRTGLRLRQVGKRWLLAIKGPSSAATGGAETRDELEKAWPDAAWKTLRSELGDELSLPAEPPSGLGPVEALRAAGLEVVQERETLRRVRNVVPPRPSRRAVAELAIDTVSYRVGERRVRHHEVEVEAKRSGGEAAVATVTASLVGQFWPRLRPWAEAKLPTGKAIEQLIRERRAEELVAEDGSLRPEAYDAIARLLERESD